MSENESNNASEEPVFNEKEYIEHLFELEEENDNAEEDTAADNQETENNQNEKKANKSNKFPHARIRTLMKMDPDLNLASNESVILIARATEIFLSQLSKSAYQFTAKTKRKTLMRRDVDAAIESIDSLCFLEGALD